MIPVKLRNYFPSQSMTNFFGWIEISFAFQEDTTFEDVLADVADSALLVVRQDVVSACDINDAVRLLIPYPSDYSFPSGHTAVSFAAASARYFAGEKYLWKAALGLAAFIAFSRMYLYVHYPSDILGGVVLGILVGKLAYDFGIKLGEKKKGSVAV